MLATNWLKNYEFHKFTFSLIVTAFALYGYGYGTATIGVAEERLVILGDLTQAGKFTAIISCDRLEYLDGLVFQSLQKGFECLMNRFGTLMGDFKVYIADKIQANKQLTQLVKTLKGTQRRTSMDTN